MDKKAKLNADEVEQVSGGNTDSYGTDYPHYVLCAKCRTVAAGPYYIWQNYNGEVQKWKSSGIPCPNCGSTEYKNDYKQGSESPAVS